MSREARAVTELKARIAQLESEIASLNTEAHMKGSLISALYDVLSTLKGTKTRASRTTTVPGRPLPGADWTGPDEVKEAKKKRKAKGKAVGLSTLAEQWAEEDEAEHAGTR